MKLVRFGEKGKEKPGLWKDGNIVDLKKIFPEIPDIGEVFFRENWLEKIAEINDPGQTFEDRIGCPIHGPSKIICLGKNYAEHAKEGGFENPEKPLIFCKTPNTLNGPFDPIILPKSSGQIDWEVELAIIIGKEGKRISRVKALDYIAGFTVMNDVSGREAQFSDSQWFRGKSFDGFAPVGPFIVTPDEIGDVNNLRLTAKVDGEIMQDGNTRDMIFDISTIIEDISEDITLIPGDIISTGTPAGVGIFRDPPVVLKPGNVVECYIENIGTLINKVIM
ncbi:MAG: fumarylacetoacetate hydrolase family protein [Desulfobacteraceae bacterium]|nr:fumarylacetoacetate hydrolase family protein [Desulfobacteraceae bacterium]MDH3835464.1 fumarylacetoacetate hydrolase family protein [Desulfobacteraceae bacterium]MDH3874409.1 fumarylacetoacetate hydrolase family protein [Desulfobacteraceae bacterium]